MEPVHAVMNSHHMVTAGEPFLEGGVVWAPIRGIADWMGGAVVWNGNERSATITVQGISVTVWIGSTQAEVNGVRTEMPAPARLVGGQTMVPVRFVCEALGARVGWNQEARAVLIDWFPDISRERRLGRVPVRTAALTAASEPPVQTRAEQMVRAARDLLGSPYLWGGAGPGGFDCSGFVRYVAAAAGISLPRTSYAQWDETLPVAEPAPGDLVFFSTYAPGASHVGIYLGDGLFVHAANEWTGVTADSIRHGYWSEHYIGARRIPE